MQFNSVEPSSPFWRSVMVNRHLPKELADLETLSKNLWWCWNESAKALFKTIDPEIWHSSSHNPREVLDSVSLKRYEELASDGAFIRQVKSVKQEFDAYMAAKADRKEPSVGYFCMEYGLDTSLKIYSGGLGILAGDYLKETSDMNVNLVAVGLLYRYGYFTQKLSSQGNQIAEYVPQDFFKIPAEPVLDGEGKWVEVKAPYPGREISARLWKVAVGRTDLYLLDADYEANSPEDREVTHQLYGGNWENRMKQEVLLGIGGVRALRALGLNPTVYHCNEGHAAFTGLERIREYVQSGTLDFYQACEVVRASSLFTTHTPVPAGHDYFDEGMMHNYFDWYPGCVGIDWLHFIGLGKVHAGDPGERFSMSILAANLSQNVNGVSWLHGEVSKDIFAPMYPDYLPEELHVSYVTNGVHYPTWAAKEWKEVHSKVFGEEFKTHHYDKSCFKGIYEIADSEIWATKKALKAELIRVISNKFSDPVEGNHYTPKQIVAIRKRLSENVLTIGFARRFATYKRATLLFKDLDRLDAIVNNPARPVQFIFAGKAHPADIAGQDLIRQIIEISKQDRFLGKIVFVPGYDINLAKRLVQGVDVWMNNPTRPQEASGTSGEKAAMNGVMHFSVLDGWWVEGYKKGAGWALPQERTYQDQQYQDELDAATIYNIVENEIAPAYYSVDKASGISREWIGYIKSTIADVASNFTTNRMLSDYVNQYYIPQAERSKAICAKDFAKVREIAAWKRHILDHWNEVEIISCTQPQASYDLSEDSKMVSEVVLRPGSLKPEELGVELLVTSLDGKNRRHINNRTELSLESFEDGVAIYRSVVLPDTSGMYQMAIRLYPKNEDLPHRMDFPIVKWL